MEESIVTRVPPHNVEAEQSVLGAIIMDIDAASIASEIITSSDFYRPDHKLIYEAIMELYNKSEPIDLVTIQDKLISHGVLEQVGGITYLSELATSVPTSAHIRHYSKIVESKSVLRKLIKASAEISAKSFEEKDQVEEIVSYAEKQIFDIMQDKHTEDFVPVSDILVSSIDKIESAYMNKGKVTGVPTGFTDLDYRTAGLQPSDLILVAARPSMGKTAFALNLAQSAAIRAKKKVAVFSLEMSKDQLVNRMLCAQARVDAQRIRTGALENDDWKKIASAIGPLSEASIYIDDTPGITIMEMRAKCRRLKLERGLDFIMIDYLQLMSGAGKNESRQQEISEISRSLKALAREMEAPVIALSQLSRACESRADHRPMLSDLRESGAIEQDADVVMFLYRDEYYHPDTEDTGVAEVIIAKQRNGPTGTIKLKWQGEHTRFDNLERD